MPRRGHGEGSIRKRPDERWEARVRLPDGQRRSFYGKTRASVARKLAAALQALDQGIPLGDERITVADFLDLWLEDGAAPTVKPLTLDNYERGVRLHIKPHLGPIKLRELSPYHVQRWLNRLAERGLAASTIRVRLAILRRALGQGVAWGMISRNVATVIDGPKLERRRPKVLSADQARRFLAQVQGDRLEALYVVALATGMRQGELLALRWVDVDLEAAELRVERTLLKRRGTVTFGPPKSSAGRRTIPLTEQARRALLEHRERQEAARQHARDWADLGLVFTSSRGTPIDTSRLAKWYRAHLEAAGLERMRFHDLRHSCATLLLAQGVDLKVISSILGHSRIGVTADLYAQVLPALKAEAAKRLGDVLEPPSDDAWGSTWGSFDNTEQPKGE